MKHAGKREVVSRMRSASSLQRPINPRRSLANNRKPLPPLPRRRLIIRDNNGNVPQIPLNPQIKRNPTRHQTSPSDPSPVMSRASSGPSPVILRERLGEGSATPARDVIVFAGVGEGSAAA